MKLFILLSVCILARNLVASKLIFKNGGDILVDVAKETEIQPHKVLNRTSFLDLNFDCLLTIFDELNVSDLLSMSETNVEISAASTSALRQRFATKQVKVKFTYSEFQIIEDAQRINVIDTKRLAFVNVLHNYGHLLSNLEISAEVFDFDIDIGDFLAQVNIYCSETLSKLSIWSYNNKFIFNEVKKPFKKVANLAIWHRFDYSNNWNLTFTEMFPMLTHLESSFSTTKIEAIVQEKYPHLEYLKAGAINTEQGLSEDAFKELIQNHPQIKSLDVDMHYVQDGLKFLQFVSQHLPHLEKLMISECREKDDNKESINIHFENLKTLTVRAIGQVMPLNTTFGRLEELETAIAYSRSSDRWLELVKHQKTLKKLIITQYIKDSDILQIADAESNLEELVYSCACDWRRDMRVINICGCNAKVESIVQMMEKSKQLQRVKLRSGWAYEDSVFYELKNELLEWKVTRAVENYNSDCVYFERDDLY